MYSIGPYIIPSEEANSSHDDQSDDGYVYKSIGAVISKGRELFSYSHQIKACVTEGGYGVEDRVPDTFKYTKILYKYRGKESGTQGFEKEGIEENELGQSQDSAYFMGRESLLHGISCKKTYLPP